ncbi:SprT family zinc-dependent metalloprotease [Dyadobacter helix]|nr:hypothetical protein [Dyadobacter sp. CECT 9275]
MKKTIDLQEYVPELAADYCKRLYTSAQFDFFLSRPRRTRLGDFTVRPGFTPRITVNANLNPYNFLITYLHEVAHYMVYRKYNGRVRRKIAPHGAEWKEEFRTLLLPVLTTEIFPEDILLPLRKYAQNPKASTGGDIPLYSAVKRYDDTSGQTKKTELIHLTEGADFVFQNRIFVRGSVRRTRVLCVDKASQRRYTIPAHALVEAC